MASSADAQAIDRSTPALQLDPAGALCVLRSAVGALAWASPALSWRTFALGSIDGDPRAGVITRLFGIRDLALGLAVRHPSPEVRRTALQVGVMVDSIDVVASLIALGRGAPRATLVTFTGGAALFAALGIAALAEEEASPEG